MDKARKIEVLLAQPNTTNKLIYINQRAYDNNLITAKPLAPIKDFPRPFAWPRWRMLLAVDKIASYPIHLECPPLEGKTHLGFVHVVLDGVDFEFGETVCELALGVGGGEPASAS